MHPLGDADVDVTHLDEVVDVPGHDVVVDNHEDDDKLVINDR